MRAFAALVVVGTALGLAALGPAAQAGPALGVPAAAASSCRAEQLRATYTFVPFSNATGHVEYILTVTNRSSSRACSFPAPLRLTLLSGSATPLPTTQFVAPGRSYEVTLAPGQWAQALSQLSPDLFGPGEPDHGNCEPVAHALRIGIGDATIQAAMDPTPVCQHGALDLGRLRTVPASPRCSARSLRGRLERTDPPFAGVANYSLTLRNVGARCHSDSILRLRLLGSNGQRLPTRVRAGISAPYVFPRHAVETAAAALRTRASPGRRCEALATRIAITPARGARTLTVPISPPLHACDGGMVSLSGLFRNG